MRFLLVLLVVGLVVLLASRLVRRIVIFEYEKGLKYMNGQFKALLSHGAYWYLPFFTTIRTVDLRPKFVSISGQEVLSADSITLKVSLAAKYQVADPATAMNTVENYQDALYLELQLGLRELIGSAAIDEVLEKRGELSKRLMEMKAPKIAELGVALLSVEIKDIMFPGDLKKIFAQVVKARKEGLAALEKARAETATLRHLANAAQLIERHPNLMQLRALQSVGDSSGNTLVLGMPPQTMPLPISAGETDKLENLPAGEAKE
jgi:regulator of protease activity HflC (stomatin/prohibitin superfamily)